jgi:hypothetical protein
MNKGSLDMLFPNIALGESLFSVIDYVFRKYMNAKVATTSEVAQARMNNSFGGEGTGKMPPLKKCLEKNYPHYFVW